MYLVISFLVLRAGCGIWLYQFLIIAYLFTLSGSLKFGTNVGYDLLYCVRENQAPPFIILFICPLFFLSNQISSDRFLNSYESQSFQFCIHLETSQVYCGAENQDTEINFILLFPFFLFFSISHSNVIHKEIWVKDFSGTTMATILTFNTNTEYDLLYCLKENHPPAAYHCLYLSIFLSLQSKVLLQISQLLWKTVFKVCVLLESGQVYCGTENKTAEIYLPSFSFFPSLTQM